MTVRHLQVALPKHTVPKKCKWMVYTCTHQHTYCVHCHGYNRKAGAKSAKQICSNAQKKSRRIALRVRLLVTQYMHLDK